MKTLAYYLFSLSSLLLSYTTSAQVVASASSSVRAALALARQPPAHAERYLVVTGLASAWLPGSATTIFEVKPAR